MPVSLTVPVIKVPAPVVLGSDGAESCGGSTGVLVIVSGAAGDQRTPTHAADYLLLCSHRFT